MADTQELIRSLAKDSKPDRLMQGPWVLCYRLGGVLLIYAIAVGLILGQRADLSAQLLRPFFLAEIVTLFIVALTGVVSAIHLAFPDEYQQHLAVPVSILSGLAFVVVLLVQAALPPDAGLVIVQGSEIHGMECTICITSIAALPAALLLIFLHKGATVRPWASGAFACVAAAAVGCLMLRLAEPNDSHMHLIIWHYIPTLLFAAIGGVLGKLFLKW